MIKRVKKILSLILVTSFIVSCFAGCGKEKASKTGDKLKELSYAETSDAYVIFGKENRTKELTVSLPNGNEPAVRSEKSIETWSFSASKNSVLEIDLSDSFAKSAEGKDLIVTVEYYDAVKGEFAIGYKNASGEEVKQEYTASSSLSQSFLSRNIRLQSPKLNNGKDLDLYVNSTQLKISSIAVNIISPLSSNPEQTFIGARCVNTKYTTLTATVAQVSVTYFGAFGDGKHDDTYAFLTAIDYMSALGSGTLFVPEGKYIIKKQLKIPDQVCITGDSPQFTGKDKYDKGTLLMSYVGKRTEKQEESETYREGLDFILLGGDSSITNLAIYYPEQIIKDGKAIPYSWTITGNSFSTIENVVLVNSYYGIRVGTSMNQMQTIRNVYGTPLYLGMTSCGSYDITRYENIDFSKNCWLESGLENIPSKKELTNWLGNNATGFLYERIDWTWFFGLKFDGYKIGIHSRAVSNEYAKDIDSGSDSAGGVLYGADIKNCNTGILYDSVSGMGAEIINSKISATFGKEPVAINIAKNFTTSMSLTDCYIESSGKYALLNNDQAKVTLVNTEVNMKGKKPEYALMMQKLGELSIIKSKFSGGGKHIYLAKNFSGASITDTMSKETLLIDNKAAEDNIKYYYDNVSVATDTESVDFMTFKETKPASNGFVDMGEAPYNLNSDGKMFDVEDITDSLCSAIAEVSGKGGIVYIPAGVYRISRSITVPSGVEIRGVFSTAIHLGEKGTVIVTEYGKNKPNNKALFELNSNSGLSGFQIMYDKMIPTDIAPYAYTVRGNGSNIYLVNVELVNSYQGVDLLTHRCDNHYLFAVTGSFMKAGISVGAGSKNGIIRDCMFNSTLWVHHSLFDWNIYGGWGVVEGNVFEFAQKNCEPFVIANTDNELFLVNFAYGAKYGLKLTYGADVKSVGYGSDGICTAVFAEGNAKAKLIGGQFAIAGANIGPQIVTDKSFNGKLDMVSLVGYGDGSQRAAELYGTGSVNLVSSLFLQTTAKALAVKLRISDITMIGTTMLDKRPTTAVALYKEVKKAAIYGSIVPENVLFINGASPRLAKGDMPAY